MRNRISLLSARLRVGVALTLCAIGAVGCDHLLQVQDPDVVSPGNLTGADKLSTQLAASISQMQVAFGGDGTGDEGLINITGLFTDEFSFTETFPTRIVIDQRNVTNNNSTLLPVFFNVEQARAIAANASDQFNQFGALDKDHTEVLSLEGYAQTLLAETYCGAVPFSKQNPDGSQSNTTPLSTEQMLETAVATFDSAINIAADSNDLARQYLARVGKARALLDLGGPANIAEADTVVASVPTTFVYQILHSVNTARENNGVNELIFQEGRWSVSDNEGTNGLDFISSHDPRVRTEDLGIGFDGASEFWGPLKDSTRTMPDILASGAEARLIQAEAALEAGQTSTWLSDLNDLRSQVAELSNSPILNLGPGDSSLAPLSDPGDAASRLKLMFRERAFWMYATAHRLGDMRRLTRSTGGTPAGYGLPIESVFPTGTWVNANSGPGTYGPDVSFPVPLEEGNNPDFNPAQCNITTP